MPSTVICPRDTNSLFQSRRVTDNCAEQILTTGVSNTIKAKSVCFAGRRHRGGGPSSVYWWGWWGALVGKNRALKLLMLQQFGLADYNIQYRMINWRNSEVQVPSLLLTLSFTLAFWWFKCALDGGSPGIPYQGDPYQCGDQPDKITSSPASWPGGEGFHSLAIWPHAEPCVYSGIRFLLYI